MKIPSPKFRIKTDKIKAEISLEWAKSFPLEPGVYIAWQNNEIVYVGETGNLSKRMRDLRDTRNHSLRRHVGFKLYDEKATSSKKFLPKNEERLDDFFRRNIRISYLPVSLGRKELEESIFANHNPVYNQKGKRK